MLPEVFKSDEEEAPVARRGARESLQDQVDHDELRRLRKEEARRERKESRRVNEALIEEEEEVGDDDDEVKQQPSPTSSTSQDGEEKGSTGSTSHSGQDAFGQDDEKVETSAVDGETRAKNVRHLPAHLVKTLSKGKAFRKKKKKQKAKDEAGADDSKIVNRTLPLFSSITLPLVVVLCIPGLTEHWYVQVSEVITNPDGSQTVIPIDPSDPRNYAENGALLDVAISISLALAIIANISLIVRMLERGWKKGPVVPTLVTICCLLLHDIIDTIVCIVFGTIHAVNDGYDYTEAFWLTVGATIISLITTTTLIVDWYRTPNFPQAGSGLTPVQRTLMISVVVMLCYMSLGALIYVFLEDLTYINSLYFITVIATTVGFGDIAPTTPGSKVVFMIYVIIAIILVGLTISNARVAIIETFQRQYAARRKKLAKKNKERKLARKMHRKVRLEAARRAQEFAAANPQAAAAPPPISPPKPVRAPVPMTSVRGAARPRVVSSNKPTSRSNLDVWSDSAVSFIKRRVLGHKENVDHLTLEQLEADLSATMTRDGAEEEREQQIEKARQMQLLDSDAPDLDMLHQLSIANEQEYQALQNQLIKEERWDYFYKIQVVLGIFIAFWLIGALAFHFLEGWDYFDAIYFVFVFSSTVGLGDFTPKSIAGRATFIGFALVAIGVMTMLVFVLTEAGGAVTRHLLARGVVSKMKHASDMEKRKADGEADDAEHRRYRQQSAAHVKARAVQRQMNRQIEEGRVHLTQLLSNAARLDAHVVKLAQSEPVEANELEIVEHVDHDAGSGRTVEDLALHYPGLSRKQAERCSAILAYRQEMRHMTRSAEELILKLDAQQGRARTLGGHLVRLRPPRRPKMSRHLSLDSDTSDVESHAGTDDSDLDHDEDFELESEYGDGEDYEVEDDEDDGRPPYSAEPESPGTKDDAMVKDDATRTKNGESSLRDAGDMAPNAKIDHGPVLASSEDPFTGAPPSPSPSGRGSERRRSTSSNDGDEGPRTVTIPITSLQSVTLPLPSFGMNRLWGSRSSGGAAADDHGLDSRLDQARENSELHAAQPPIGYIGNSVPSSPRSEAGVKLTRTNSVRFI